MMRNWFNRWRPIWLACFIAGYVLTSLVRLASGGDYTVTRGTEIQSERPIGRLIAEAGLVVLNGEDAESGLERLCGMGAKISRTELSIDGSPAPGIGGMARAGWRLLGFLVWDADGTIERTTDFQFRGRNVGIVDRIENGKVWVRVTVGPPLGDPHVRFAVLTLEANDAERSGLAGWNHGSRISLVASAVIDLPCDARRERVHARRQRWGCDRPTLSERIAGDEAGPELETRLDSVVDRGRLAVSTGHAEIDAVVAEFLRKVCR